MQLACYATYSLEPYSIKQPLHRSLMGTPKNEAASVMFVQRAGNNILQVICFLDKQVMRCGDCACMSCCDDMLESCAPRLLVKCSPCTVCSLQEMVFFVHKFDVFIVGYALPTVMTEACENICQQDCQHLAQIMPAAILTAVEKAAEAKEQATSLRHQLPDKAQIFADGFAIGFAFLLQVGTCAALLVLLD